ncbi:Iojap-related protein [Candidatus Koribacter versatilis Ellin345]|uniref:Ribosomal silencing factor RsfS n=1 Tax=Koribacter versatilis (strain Ellin345) TaxID=204669 RepID=Q1IVS3_KORVE|nr:ribosome silencing factor [Candidatus Koribacter versatilis]ABF39027.1 Iojap-related protein [Candidatus Koribacter versatilis Ellin345]
MSKSESRKAVALAVSAAQEKKAENIAILELDKSSSGFTDYFVICTGSNPRQLQAISDEVDQKLSSIGQEPRHVEGYNQAEWVLMDYVDFVVHIFSENARKFYDLERLWKSAKHLSPEDLSKPSERTPAKSRPAAKKTAVRKSAPAVKKPRKTAAKKATKRTRG